jgi:hypothetical protein
MCEPTLWPFAAAWQLKVEYWTQISMDRRQVWKREERPSLRTSTTVPNVLQNTCLPHGSHFAPLNPTNVVHCIEPHADLPSANLCVAFIYALVF